METMTAAPLPPPVPTSISMNDLLEIAISAQDMGTVNFNALRLLLSDVIKKMEKVDREPVRLGEVDANQIANYKNYIQQGEPGATIPGVLRVPQGVDIRRGQPPPGYIPPILPGGPRQLRPPPPGQFAPAPDGTPRRQSPEGPPSQQYPSNAGPPGQQQYPPSAGQPGQQYPQNAGQPGQQYPPNVGPPAQQYPPNVGPPGQQYPPNVGPPGQQYPPNASQPGQQYPSNEGQPGQQPTTTTGGYPPPPVPGHAQWQQQNQRNGPQPSGNAPRHGGSPGSPNNSEASHESEQPAVVPPPNDNLNQGFTRTNGEAPRHGHGHIKSDTGVGRDLSRLGSHVTSRQSRRMSPHMDHGILKDLESRLEQVTNQMNYILEQVPHLMLSSTDENPPPPPSTTDHHQGGVDMEGAPDRKSMRRQSVHSADGESTDGSRRKSKKSTSDRDHGLEDLKDHIDKVDNKPPPNNVEELPSISSFRGSQGATSTEPSMSQSRISESEEMEEEAKARHSDDYEGPERSGSYGNLQDATVDDGLFGDMMKQMTGIENQVSAAGSKKKKKKKKDKGGVPQSEAQLAETQQALSVKELGQEQGAMSVNDMWQMIQLNNRIAGAESAIQKMASLIEDLARELTRLRWDTETTQAIQEDTILLIEGEDKCMGPGICKGHGMPAGIAVCQFTDPAETTTKVDKSLAFPEDACPVCGNDTRDNTELLNLKKPRRDPPQKELAASALKVSPHHDQLVTVSSQLPGVQMALEDTDGINIDLEQIRETLKTVDFGEFDERDTLHRIGTLWEAVKLLKAGEDSLSKRIDKNEQLIKKIPKEKMAKMLVGEYTDVNPASMTSPVVAPPPPPRNSRLSVPHPPKADDVPEERADDDKEDIQTLFNNLANVIAECAEQKERIDQLVDAVRIIESGMVTKQFLMDMISDKADKGQINTKVSYDEFGNTVDELHAQLHNLMIEGYQRNENWKKVTSDLAEELSEKLDKVELSPIRAFFKSRLKKLEDRVTSLSTLLDEPDPAGTRKKLLRDYNCISCDRKVNITGAINTCILPTLGSSTAMPSSASHRAYDLHRLRTQRTNFDANAKEIAELENQMKSQTGRNLSYTGKERQLSERDMMQLVSRYTGSKGDTPGPVALPSLRLSQETQPQELQITEIIQSDPATASIPQATAAMIETEVALRMSGEYMLEAEE